MAELARINPIWRQISACPLVCKPAPRRLKLQPIGLAIFPIFSARPPASQPDARPLPRARSGRQGGNIETYHGKCSQTVWIAIRAHGINISGPLRWPSEPSRAELRPARSANKPDGVGTNQRHIMAINGRANIHCLLDIGCVRATATRAQTATPAATQRLASGGL